MTNPIAFVPLLLATFALAYVSYSKFKTKQTWLTISFVVWITIFILTLVTLGVFK